MDSKRECTILLMNTGAGHSIAEQRRKEAERQGNGGTGPTGVKDSEKRAEAFKRVVEDTKPSIIFLQEATGKFERVLSEDYIGINVKGRRPSMIFDKKELTCKYITDEKAKLLKKFVNKSPSDPFPLHRLCVVECTSKWSEFLAISWHGPHNNYTVKMKKDVLKNFFVVVKQIRELYRSETYGLLPVIIGGDFNLRIDQCPQDDDLIIPEEYTPSGRRDKQIDFFVATQDLNVSDEKFLDMAAIKNASDFLDHDPVTAVLSLSED